MDKKAEVFDQNAVAQAVNHHVDAMLASTMLATAAIDLLDNSAGMPKPMRALIEARLVFHQLAASNEIARALKLVQQFAAQQAGVNRES